MSATLLLAITLVLLAVFAVAARQRHLASVTARATLGRANMAKNLCASRRRV